jgi:hypothetical protein
MAAELAASPDAPAADPRLLGTLVQALLHGLAMQLAAEPNAFNREAMFRLCLDVLGGYLKRGKKTPSRGNGATPRAEGRRRPARQPRGDS